MKSQRVSTIRPPKGKDHDELHPLQDEKSGDLEVEKEQSEGGLASEDADTEWAAMEAKVEDLQKRLAEHFEDANEQHEQNPPMIRAFRQPTEEEWNRHQTTHTPYEAWCPHCVVA